MIAWIRGTLEELDDHRALIGMPIGDDGCALAHEVVIPSYLRSRLTDQIGRRVTLHTLEHLEPTASGASFTPRLFGFGTAEERRFVLVFTTVKGVGLRRAMRALAVPPNQVAYAICARDAKTLVALPEIGTRLADTIIAELHGKVDEFAPGDDVPPRRAASQIERGPMGNEPARRAVAALVRLGESERSAEDLVGQAIETSDEQASAEKLVALALSHR